MSFALGRSVAVAAFIVSLCGCGSAGAQEPSEAQMKDATLYEMNHPPGETLSDPVKIVFFNKEACGNPTPRGYRCTFDVKAASANPTAGYCNDIPFAWFYKDKSSGKWAVRPPF